MQRPRPSGALCADVTLFQLNQRLTKNLKLFLSLSIAFKMIIIFLIHATIATLDQVSPLKLINTLQTIHVV